MNLKMLTNVKLIVILREKKHIRYLICAKLFNRIGSALYNLALLTLAAKQTYSTLAISLAKLLENLPNLLDPVLAYLSDKETKRLKKAALLNKVQMFIYLIIAFFMFQYQMSLEIFALILFANVLSDSIDGYISNMFIPFSKTWVTQSERRVISSLDIVLFSLSVVVGQLLGAAWLVIYPNHFFSLSLLNSLTFAVSLFFLRKIKFDDTVKPMIAVQSDFSIPDFFQKMKSAYTHMCEHHVVQTMWLLAFGKEFYVGYMLLLNVAMVSHSNLRFGSYSQTLVILQLTSFIGLILGSFFRVAWLEQLTYGQFIMFTNITVLLSTLSCYMNLSLGILLFLKLIGTILSGYMAPRYYTELIQKIDEEQLTRVESLNGFILMLSAPMGILQTTFFLQLFGLRISWLIQFSLLLVFILVGELLLYWNK